MDINTTFVTIDDLDHQTRAELERIQAIPEARRTTREAAFIDARAQYLTNEIISSSDDGIREAQGLTLPSGEPGFRVGAIFILLDQGEGESVRYQNVGTLESCDFQVQETSASVYNLITVGRVTTIDGSPEQSFEIEGLHEDDIVVASLESNPIGAVIKRAYAEVGNLRVEFEDDPQDATIINYVVYRIN